MKCVQYDVFFSVSANKNEKQENNRKKRRQKFADYCIAFRCHSNAIKMNKQILNVLLFLFLVISPCLSFGLNGKREC